MVGIIIKGVPTYKKDKRVLDDLHKDKIHQERKEVERELRKTIFNKDKMNQTDCRSTHDEAKRVQDYDRWKKTKTSYKGMTNEQLMSRWGELNRAMKRKGEEGRPQCLDFVRQRRSTKYE